MKNTTNTPSVTEFGQILKKIKSLKKDTVYPYQILAKPSDKFRVYISRLADKGIIVKVNHKYFLQVIRHCGNLLFYSGKLSSMGLIPLLIISTFSGMMSKATTSCVVPIKESLTTPRSLYRLWQFYDFSFNII